MEAVTFTITGIEPVTGTVTGTGTVAVTVNQQMSLFIPHVFMNITSERIVTVFETLGFGKVKRVDLVNKGKYNRVYIHFEEWYENEMVARFQEKIMNKDKVVRIIYDDPYYWMVLENTSASKNAMPSSLGQQNKITINIEDESEINDDSNISVCSGISEREYRFVVDQEDALEEFVHRDYAELLEQEIRELRSIIAQRT